MRDKIAQQLHGGRQAVKPNELVGLVRLVDVARSQNDGVHPELLQQRPLGAEGNTRCIMAGQAFSNPDQFAVRGSEESGQRETEV